jgi:hypothetical protein
MLKMSSIERKFLLPVIMAASFLIVLAGMKALNHAKPCKNKLIPRNAVEIQVKASEAGISKAGQGAEFHGPACSFAPTALYIAFRHHNTLNDPSASADAIPARAPPGPLLA